MGGATGEAYGLLNEVEAQARVGGPWWHGPLKKVGAIANVGGPGGVKGEIRCRRKKVEAPARAGGPWRRYGRDSGFSVR